jgi:Fur family peroxide stress response transcriptional regulator
MRRASVSESELEKRLARFREAARESGLKLTHQRLEIFREVASTEEHPDAETVFRGVRERIPTISLDTVYRTLWLLEDLGVISALGPRRERVRFDANPRSHHHFVCESCGLVRDIESKELDSLTAPSEINGLASVSRVCVEIRGLCESCAAEAVGGEAEAAGGKSEEGGEA